MAFYLSSKLEEAILINNFLGACQLVDQICEKKHKVRVYTESARPLTAAALLLGPVVDPYAIDEHETVPFLVTVVLQTRGGRLSRPLHFLMPNGAQRNIGDLKDELLLRFNLPPHIQRCIVAAQLPEDEARLGQLGDGRTLNVRVYLRTPAFDSATGLRWPPDPVCLDRLKAQVEEMRLRRLMPPEPEEELDGAVAFENPQAGWICPQCTYLNPPRRPGCEGCAADRPADYIVPDGDGVAEDDDEQENLDDFVDDPLNPTWRCPQCTCRNPAYRPSCQLCSLDRPADYAPPPGYQPPKAIDEHEQQLLMQELRDFPGWLCSKCTYKNAPTRPACQICAHDRPADYQPPAGYQPPPEELQRDAQIQRERLEIFTHGMRQQVPRQFDCGHTEKLSWYANFRRVNNQLCSKCWSLAAQIHKEKLQHAGGAAAAEGEAEGPAEIRRTPLTPENEDTAVEYFKVEDRVLRYVKPEHGIKVQVVSIEKIVNTLLDRRLFEVYNVLHKKDCVPELLIHGTRGDIAEKIIAEGFKVGTGGMYGAGIYFATDTTKSAQYCRENGLRSLLLCEVVLGKTMVCNAPKNNLNLDAVNAAGYDSVFARRASQNTQGVANDEYIVYRSEQASPRYLVKFQ